MPKFRHESYDEDDETFSADAYKVAGYGGVAFRVLGWETEPDEDTEWSGIETRTGMVSVIMVGDDRVFHINKDELAPIAREDYCGSCGQMGCTHDGLDREELENVG